MAKKVIRIGLYVLEDKYRKLKAKLALKGTTVSAWLRDIIEQEINE